MIYCMSCFNEISLEEYKLFNIPFVYCKKCNLILINLLNENQIIDSICKYLFVNNKNKFQSQELMNMLRDFFINVKYYNIENEMSVVCHNQCYVANNIKGICKYNKKYIYEMIIYYCFHQSIIEINPRQFENFVNICYDKVKNKKFIIQRLKQLLRIKINE